MIKFQIFIPVEIGFMYSREVFIRRGFLGVGSVQPRMCNTFLRIDLGMRSSVGFVCNVQKFNQSTGWDIYIYSLLFIFYGGVGSDLGVGYWVFIFIIYKVRLVIYGQCIYGMRWGVCRCLSKKSLKKQTGSILGREKKELIISTG